MLGSGTYICWGDDNSTKYNLKMHITIHVGTKQKLCKWDQPPKKKGVNICFGSLGACILCDHSYSSTLNTLSLRLGDNALCQNCGKISRSPFGTYYLRRNIL